MHISKTLYITNRNDWRAWLENKATPLKDKTVGLPLLPLTLRCVSLAIPLPRFIQLYVCRTSERRIPPPSEPVRARFS